MQRQRGSWRRTSTRGRFGKTAACSSGWIPSLVICRCGRCTWEACRRSSRSGKRGRKIPHHQQCARADPAHPESRRVRVARRAGTDLARVRTEDQAPPGQGWPEHLTRSRARNRRSCFQELPDHLARMAFFKVNTGCRDQEVCGLKWDDEVKVPELDTSVFIIPGDRVKNAQDRLVVSTALPGQWWRLKGANTRTMCSPTCRSEGMPKPGEQQKGAIPVRVFRMNNSAWQSARARAADKWEQQAGLRHRRGFGKCACTI